MGAGGHSGVTDLDEEAFALVGILTVAVRLFQQHLCVADLTLDATARHCLKVCACAKRLCAKLLQTDSNGLPIQIKQWTTDLRQGHAGGHVEVNVEVETNLFAVFGDSCSQRVFTVVLSCTYDGQQPGSRHPVPFHNYLYLDNLRRTICDGPCLIKYHRLDLPMKGDMIKKIYHQALIVCMVSNHSNI